LCAWRKVLAMALLVALGLGVVALAVGRPIRILFMHHSTGGNLIQQGGVRDGLTALGYEFWDHGYNEEGLSGPDGSPTGTDFAVPDDNTNPDGWAAIFAQPVTDPPTNTLSTMLGYDVILFKSCFPTSDITDEEMLVDYERYYLSIRDVIDRHPDKLFVAFTPPPLVPGATSLENAARAKRWAAYLASDEYGKGHPNLAVFDFFSLLADRDGYLRVEYRSDESDSHPNDLANRTIGPVLVRFVRDAIERRK